MLEFFRRYQKIVFIGITIVIVISFTFFGPYSNVMTREEKDTVAFTAVDGSRVYRSELNDLVNFISVGHQAHLQWNVSWGGNPFNDDVIPDYFLETGIAEVIVAPYLKTISYQLNNCLEKEKRYVPYANEKAPFVGAENVWNYFAPDIKKNLDTLKDVPNAATQEAFSTRVKLFLAERKFPASYLKRILKYQESEHSWLAPDPELPYRDLALFGYHSIQDWFGRDFLELIAEYIINSAKIAEGKGYTVNKDQALQSLMANLQSSFKESRNNPYLATQNINDYYNESLRKLGMDQVRLVNVWTQVLLFRELFAENTDSMLVSSLPYKDFYQHLDEYVAADVYKLPQELCFQNLDDVERYEIYVNAVRDSKESKAKGSAALLPPNKFLTIAEVKKLYPELIQKIYRVRYASVNKEALQTKIGVKKTWEWEVQDKNWKKLQEKFPELAMQKAKTEDERFAALDQIEPKTRNLIDAYSRSFIIDEHPEWIKEALDANPMREDAIDVRQQGGKLPFIGVSDRIALGSLLDQARLNEANPALDAYTQDNIHYHRIDVLEKPTGEVLLTFKEALNDGTLDQLLNKILESAYLRVRTQKPTQFMKDNGEWKPLQDVKEQIASSHFEELFQKLDAEREREEKAMPYFCNWKDKDKARVAVCMLPYMKEVLKKIKLKPEQEALLVQDPKNTQENPLIAQWKLVRGKEKVARKGDSYSVDQLEAFSLQSDAFSKLRYMGKAGITFFKVFEKGVLPYEEQVRAKVLEARELLGKAIEQDLAKVLLTTMQQKNAIQLQTPQAEETKSQTTAPMAVGRGK